MNINELIQPINDKHSIKEAVISIFLANPIIKPERFKQLIESNFKDKFQKFETVNQVEFQLQNDGNNPPTLNQQLLPNVGFKFIAFEKGESVKVLQGINEKSRNFISYHSLNYDRWNDFYKEYLDVLKSLSELHSDFFVTAFSLHYIDQFLWNGALPIDLASIFNNEANYISKEFFASKLNNYSIVLEKENKHGIYIDRIEIKVDHVIKPMITISHNVTQPLKDIMSLNELLESTLFSEILNICHLHNKELLNDILTENVVELIKLKKNG
jgi:uncharacterized protein (TIGR04255 family)